jgi:hypothetical protein
MAEQIKNAYMKKKAQQNCHIGNISLWKVLEGVIIPAPPFQFVNDGRFLIHAPYARPSHLGYEGIV